MAAIRKVASFSFLLLFIIGGCAENSPDVTGNWNGNTTSIIDGETDTVNLSLMLTQSEQGVSGNVRWGEMDEAISRSDWISGEVVLVSEWDEGSITLRGRVVDNVMTGRFSYRYHMDPESFPASFEVTRE